MAFEKNLKKLAKLDPELAEAVKTTSVEGMELCRSRGGEQNLSYTHNGHKHLMHSNYSPSKETKKWFDKLNLKQNKAIDLLYLFGIGLGYSFDHIEKWLDEKVERYLVLIEDDLRVLRYFLETKRARKLLDHKQVIIFHLPQAKAERETACRALTEYFVGVRFMMAALPHYDLCRGTDYDQLQLSIRHESAHVNYASIEFFQYGAGYYGNFYHTLLHLAKSHWGYRLINGFQGVPAIIVGAGPSLNKNIDVIKEYKDRACIFAGGSAVNALTSKGIEPHFGASVDPNPEQHSRMIKQSAHELPMFYKGRIHHRAFSALHGPRIYLPGSPAYPVTTWMEEQHGIHAKLMREGHNVLHLLIELASFMGCDPIIFAGMDLAYSDNQLYADGVVSNPHASEEELTKRTHLNNNCFLRKDIYGNPVYTLWKWVAESQYTAAFPETYPHITYVNSTEGGLGMGDIPNTPLKEVAQKYLHRQIDIQSWVHADLMDSRFTGFDEKKTMDVYDGLAEDLENAQSNCDAIKTLLENLKEAVLYSRGDDIERISEEIEEEKKQLENNVAYQQILYPLITLRSIMFQRRLDQIEYDRRLSDEKEKIKKMCETNIEEMENHLNAIKINLARMEEALKDYSQDGYGDTSQFFIKQKERKKQCEKEQKTEAVES